MVSRDSKIDNFASALFFFSFFFFFFFCWLLLSLVFWPRLGDPCVCRSPIGVYVCHFLGRFYAMYLSVIAENEVTASPWQPAQYPRRDSNIVDCTVSTLLRFLFPLISGGVLRVIVMEAETEYQTLKKTVFDFELKVMSSLPIPHLDLWVNARVV